MEGPFVRADATSRRGSIEALRGKVLYGEGDYRVFYNDMIAAIKWLAEDPATTQLSRVK